MKVDFLAGEPQFIDHLASVYLAMPDTSRGDFIVWNSPHTRMTVSDLIARAVKRRVFSTSETGDPERPILVASWGDHQQARRMGRKRIARMEHGIGQSFVGSDHSSYAGGRDADDIELFLVPNAHSADRWQRAYPQSSVAIVGCPKLDSLPRAREHSIGVQSLGWANFDAGIRTLLTTFGTTSGNGVVCVAHAIADVSPKGLVNENSPVMSPKPNTIELATSLGDPKPQIDQHDPDEPLMEAVKSAISACTTSSKTSCLGRVTSAGQLGDLRSRSGGIRLRNSGNSARSGLLTLSIPTTTFGSVSLVMSNTTTKDTSLVMSFTRAVGAEPPVIATSFHWSAGTRIGPLTETNGSFPEYRAVLGDLVKDFSIIGHGHPRGLPTMGLIYRRHGIPIVDDFEDVCRQADVYVCDTNSTIYEFAATGRPVVVVNGKHFRRNVDHGLRFWEAAPVGVQCNATTDLVAAIREALEDAPARKRARERALDIVYAHRTGAAERAAAELTTWVESRQAVAA